MDKLRAMRTFAQVAREGTLAKAARALDVTPASVSRQLVDLETQLGARLVNRTTRSLALTEIGKRHLRNVQHILGDLDEAEALVRDEMHLPRGLLQAQVPAAVASHLLVKRLGEFQARHPKVALEVSVNDAVTTINEHYDVCVLLVDRDLSDSNMVARQLAVSEIVSCAAPGYLDRRGRPEHPSDLEQHDVVLPHNLRRKVNFTPMAHDGASRAGKPVSVAMPEPKFKSNNIELNYRAAMEEVGIAGLPSFVVADALREGRLERVLPDWHVLTLRLYAAVPAQRNLPARTRAFIDFLRECFGGDDVDPWLAVPQGPAATARRSAKDQ